jgi:hypothetical protein
MYPAASHRPVRAGGLVPLLVIALAAATASAESFPVVLADGHVVQASSPPFIAMGQVSFLDVQGRPQLLKTSQVNVAATRERAGQPASHSRVWTGAAMAKLPGGVQYVGEEGEASSEEVGEADASSAPPDGGSEVDQLRSRIAQVDAKVQTLSTHDRQRTLLIFQQLELQEELSRLLAAPRVYGRG